MTFNALWKAFKYKMRPFIVKDYLVFKKNVDHSTTPNEKKNLVFKLILTWNMWGYSTFPRERLEWGFVAADFSSSSCWTECKRTGRRARLEMQYLYRKILSNFMDFTEILKCFIVFIMGLILCGALLVMCTKAGLFITQTQLPWTLWSWSKGLMSIRGCSSLLVQGMLNMWAK